MVVDDDPETCDCIAVYRPQYKLINAENGKVAQENSEEYHSQLIISDVILPQLDGIDLCKAIRNDFRISHLPIILLTARSEIETDCWTGSRSRLIHSQAFSSRTSGLEFVSCSSNVKSSKIHSVRLQHRQDSLLIPDPFFTSD
jgi:CheY-like chemotaxis protein